jgi:biopolymer transport protein ExbD
VAEKRRFLDVWIIESNTVYREVPFTVVTDWVQQGRLLGDDRVRPSGTRDWYPIGTMPTFAAYMPKVDEHRAEDQAEALDRVEIDFTWKRRPEDDDEDVDMIPLIDISLVLLIFFMMTAAVGAGFLSIDTPMARSRNIVLSEDMKLWVGIDTKTEKGGTVNRNRPAFSFGVGNDIIIEPTRDRADFLRRLGPAFRDQLMKEAAAEKKDLSAEGGEKASAKINVRIQGDQTLPIEVIKNTAVDLKNLEAALQGKTFGRVQIVIAGEVSEPQSR